MTRGRKVHVSVKRKTHTEGRSELSKKQESDAAAAAAERRVAVPGRARISASPRAGMRRAEPSPAPLLPSHRRRGMLAPGVSARAAVPCCQSLLRARRGGRTQRSPAQPSSAPARRLREGSWPGEPKTRPTAEGTCPTFSIAGPGSSCHGPRQLFP